MTPPIYAHFDLVTNGTSATLTGLNLWQVPLVGETVIICENPYRVTEVRWRLDPNRNDEPQCAFVKVQKAADFSVTLRGREY